MTITATHDIADYKVDLIAHFLAVEGEGGYPYYDRATKNSDNEYQNVTIGYGINIKNGVGDN